MQVLSSNPLVQKQAHGESTKLVVQKLVTVLFSSNSSATLRKGRPSRRDGTEIGQAEGCVLETSTLESVSSFQLQITIPRVEIGCLQTSEKHSSRMRRYRTPRIKESSRSIACCRDEPERNSCLSFRGIITNVCERSWQKW